MFVRAVRVVGQPLPFSFASWDATDMDPDLRALRRFGQSVLALVSGVRAQVDREPFGFAFLRLRASASSVRWDFKG